MELELAVALTCATAGCRVRYVDDGATGETRYSSAMQDRIKIRPYDLVAVDRGSEPPQTVWRWRHGIVTDLDGATAFVERNVTQREPGDPRRGTEMLRVPDWLREQVRPGVVVYDADHESILDLASDAGPLHPDRVRAAFAQIEATYASLGDRQ